MKVLWVFTAVAATFAPKDEDLAGSARKASEMTCYSFKVDTTVEGGAKGHRPASYEAKFVKDQPAWFKGSAGETFRKGGVIVAKEGEEWKKVERVKGEKGQKGQAALLMLGVVKLPHEELTDFDKSFKEAKKAEQKENDCTVWSGDLTDEAARSLGSLGTRASAKADLTYSGSAKLWINAEGAIVKYELVLKMKGKMKDRDVDATTTRRVEISEIGTAKVEVPEGAKKALEGQS